MSSLKKPQGFTQTLITLFGMMILTLSPLMAYSKAEALKHYEKAQALFSKDRQANHQEIVEELEKGKALLVSKEQLGSSEESILVKINSLLYWTNKFSTLDKNGGQSKTAKKTKREKKSIKIAKKSAKNWGMEIKKKKKVYSDAESQVKEYESLFPNDHIGNLKNYLSLHEKTSELDDAKRLQEKIKSIHMMHLNKQKQALENALKEMDNYASLIENKNYEILSSKLKRLYKSRGLSDSNKSLILDFYFEVIVMQNVIDTLKDGTDKNVFIAKNKDIAFDGFIVEADEDGFKVRQAKGRASTFVEWKYIEEKTLMALVPELITPNTNKNRFSVALAHLRMGELSEVL